MYGAPVTQPMEIPYSPPSQFSRAPLPEMAKIKDASAGTVRLEGTLAKRLPNMPSGDLNDLAFTNSRQVEAAELMNDMRYVYDISRQQKNRSNAISRAKGRQAQRQVERGSAVAENRLSQAQGRSVRMNTSTILRNARDVLGMGTDLYK